MALASVEAECADKESFRSRMAGYSGLCIYCNRPAGSRKQRRISSKMPPARLLQSCYAGGLELRVESTRGKWEVAKRTSGGPAMFRSMSFVAGLGLCFLAATSGAAGAESKSVSDVIGQEQIAALRARGPEGLAEAFRNYDELNAQGVRLQEEMTRLSAAGLEGRKDTAAELGRQIADVGDRLENWRAAIDQIGGQRTCSISRLYWYTDLDAAKAEAKRTDKPVLSL